MKKWTYKVIIITFVLTILFSFIANGVLKNVNIYISFILLFLIVLLGIVSDTIGIAVTACVEQPFHAMASKKIKSAKYSLLLIKNAGQVSNFCNDVIGDIVGIISGTTLITIVGYISTNSNFSFSESFISVVFSAFIAALTVGGKAIGKEVALNYSKTIVHLVGKVIGFFDENLKLNILKKDK